MDFSLRVDKITPTTQTNGLGGVPNFLSPTLNLGWIGLKLINPTDNIYIGLFLEISPEV